MPATTAIVRVSLEEAQGLMQDGYVYVDVRTEPEFEKGHVPGAVNVPSMHRGPNGLAQNPDFLTVMEQAFDKGERLLIGCQSGGRSLKAAQLLDAAGFTNLRELRTGFEGSRDPFGRVEPGWSKKGLPVEAGAPEGRTYDDLKRRRR